MKKIKKHLNFCLKYPETVLNSDNSLLIVQYIINEGIIPVVNYFKVWECAKLYKNIDSNVFIKFKDIINDWNDMIPIDANKIYRT